MVGVRPAPGESAMRYHVCNAMDLLGVDVDLSCSTPFASSRLLAFAPIFLDPLLLLHVLVLVVSLPPGAAPVHGALPPLAELPSYAQSHVSVRPSAALLFHPRQVRWLTKELFGASLPVPSFVLRL